MAKKFERKKTPKLKIWNKISLFFENSKTLITNIPPFFLLKISF
jgi:hypothetical protein